MHRRPRHCQSVGTCALRRDRVHPDKISRPTTHRCTTHLRISARNERCDARLRQWGLRCRRIDGLGRAGVATGPTSGIVWGPRGAVGRPRCTRMGLTALATISATRWRFLVGTPSGPGARRRSVWRSLAGWVRRRFRRRCRPTLPRRLARAISVRVWVEEWCVAGAWTARPWGARGRMARGVVAGLGCRLGG
jgi:hypothetical protein